MNKRLKILSVFICFVIFMGLIKGYLGEDLAKWFWKIYFALISVIIFIGLLATIKNFFKK